jgi:hypothetical protein
MPSNNKSIKRGGGKPQNNLKRGGGSQRNTVKRGGAKPQNNLKHGGAAVSERNTVKRGGGSQRNTVKRGGGSQRNTVKRGGASKRNTVKRGGAKPQNNIKRGGAVRMPSEYYGVESGRYFADGSPELANGDSAYGKFIDVSQGVSSLSGMVGPNVASYPNASCTQTGGAKRSKNSKRH